MARALAAVLIVAGVLSGGSAHAGEVSVDVGTLSSSRYWSAGVKLADGRVLLTGGGDDTGECVNDANIYDPSTRALTPVGPMTEPRKLHQAVLLADGRVLVVGGYCAFMASKNSAEIFDPATNTFSPTGWMGVGRARFTATALADGRVLVAGGGIWGTTTTEVYDPASGTFTATGLMSLPRKDHTATLLPSGEVLVAGGWDNFTQYGTAREIEAFDPVSGEFRNVGMMIEGRANHAAAALADGTLLVTGGFTTEYAAGVASAEIFDPATGTTEAISPMNAGRWSHTMATLDDGRVVVFGGAYGPPTEFWDPATRTFFASAAPRAARNTSVVAFAVSPTSVLVAGDAPGLELWIDDDFAPTTDVSLDAPWVDGWYVGPLSVALSAVDVGESGVARTEYSVAGGPWTTYAAPFLVEQDGSVLIQYRSIDRAGNVEDAQGVAVLVDNAPPTVASTFPAAGAVGVSRYGLVITVTFAEPVAAGATSPAASLTYDRRGTPTAIPATVAVAGSAIVVKLTDRAPSRERLTVTVPAGAVVDRVGRTNPAPFVFSFTTR